MPPIASLHDAPGTERVALPAGPDPPAATVGRDRIDGRSPTERRSPEEAAAVVERLYRKHFAFVFRLALRYGRGRRAWADDVVQDVFVDLLRALPTLRDLDAIEGWLYRATAHRCLKRVRRDRLFSMLPIRWLLGTPEQEPVHAEGAAVARHDLERVVRALDALAPKERIAFSMFHLDGKSQDEIGEILGHKKSYVCKLIRRATEELREAGWEVPDAAP